MKKILSVALCAFGVTAASAAPAAATPGDAWIGAHPAINIRVAPAVNGTFQVKATVRDLRNGNVLSEPRLLVKAGVPAKAEIGAAGTPGSTAIAFTVLVASDGKSAAYNSEIRSNGETVAAENAQLVVGE